jgi:hypothetical protein
MRVSEEITLGRLFEDVLGLGGRFILVLLAEVILVPVAADVPHFLFIILISL